MTAFQLLIKPSGPDCNLDCTYCFYRRVAGLFPEHSAHRMSEQILGELISQYLASGFPASVFSWQGGEPTLCGLSFFEKAVELQMSYGRGGQRVSNSLQTNGLLLDRDWCQFLKKYKFLVGLSLDGPQPLHDHYRRRGDKGSWERVMRAAKLLSDYDIEFNILCMVTRESQGRARKLFYWFLEHGFRYLQFIPCLERGGESGIEEFSVTPGGYGDFLCELFDAWWENSDRGVSIRTFDSVLNSLVAGTASMCVFCPSCRSYLVIEHDGSVYPCDFFVRESTRLGNIMDEPLEKLFQSAPYRDFGMMKSLLPGECQKCRWLSLCHGGCQKDRIDSRGEPAPMTYFCSSYKRFLSHSLPRLKTLVPAYDL